MTNPIVKTDEVAQKIVGSWNIYSTALATSIAAVVGYKLLYSKEPDIHPFLLARQAAESELRRQGESATFRSLQTPHGYSLKTGLNISDPEAPKWTPGRDGDLRDIWKAVLRGAVDARTGRLLGVTSKFHVVLGQALQTYEAHQVTREINLIGRKIRELRGEYVAVCLCNSIELLAIIFGTFGLLSPLGGFTVGGTLIESFQLVHFTASKFSSSLLALRQRCSMIFSGERASIPTLPRLDHLVSLNCLNPPPRSEISSP